MKKTVLISTALILSAATFAQTQVSNHDAVKGQTKIEHSNTGTQVNSSQNASSATTMHTDVVKNGKSSAAATIKEKQQAMVAEKQSLAAKAKAQVQQTASVAKDGATVVDNNLDQNSSTNSNGSVSVSNDNNTVGKLKSSQNESIHATLKGDNRSQVAVEKTADKPAGHIKAASKSAVHTTAGAAHSVRIKPVSVKTGAHINTGAGIGIGR